MSLLYLSLTHCTKHVPRVPTNAERLLAFRAALPAEPCNSFDWEKWRRQSQAVQPNVVSIKRRQRA